MNVGLVVYGDLEPRSGGYRYDRRLVEGLRERGDRVEVVSLPETSRARAFTQNLSRRVVRDLDRPFDVLLQDELCHPSLVGLNRRIDREYPIVSIVHHLRASEHSGLRRRLSRELERAYLSTVDAVVCNSRHTRAAVAELTAAPGLIAWPGVDRFAGLPTDAEITARARRDPFEVVFVGNLLPRKSLDALVRGLARVGGDWHLTVVGTAGDPAYAAEVRDLVRERGFANRVDFTGWLDDGELAARLGSAHLLAVPSTHEGFGMVYLEGMAFGLPALAAASGGASDLVTEGRTGHLIDPSDERAITTTVEALASDRDRLAAMSLAARRRFERHPTWDATVDRVRAFLEHRIARSGQSPA
ncbi:glycosyltransferase family 4 protein [Halalkalicoccus jeotgali]|uniref:Glycosyl transferase group 1 n=1 Tax=Halalkalicoccus jeotgali (strain DSM 18796 / CECT 7217 / JCM 14584 / KCTC 4019 / B3) TaxID=795797 RepID=D8J9B3_HALJB|nr:glycosyltransferase family 4 protein [Halalkalicoccus jeotgali]ADJ16382.1 glycosyl transferase group 1 [Halalkalicoccus jeotgali B3]ELY37116.1 group 1 glycosyl transferase [Halalkalicoccus jeotgali B3]